MSIIDSKQSIYAGEGLGKIILSNNGMTVTIRGIAKEGLFSINTLVWKEEPPRSDDGSMPDIENDTIPTFIVARCKSNLRYFNIQEYINLVEFLAINKQFNCTYFDYNAGLFVTRKMYCEPQEIRKIRNARHTIEGIYDCEFSFIGTRNDNEDTQTVTFNANGGSGAVPTAKTGKLFDTIQIPIETFTKGGKTSSGFNSRADGNGRHYNAGQTTMIYGTYTLYADFGRTE